MSSQDRLDQLRSLRAEIAALGIVKCRMSHERVVTDEVSGLPVICRVPEGSYQRIGLCAPEVRARRLGCSHTSARILLDDAITLLGTSKGESDSSVSQFHNEFVWLNNAIHLLDHRKGEAEKRMARILQEARQGGPGDHGEKLRSAENEVNEMEETHDEYVERIGRLRDQVIEQIDKLLEARMMAEG